jgi:hypothetical protein
MLISLVKIKDNFKVEINNANLSIADILALLLLDLVFAKCLGGAICVNWSCSLESTPALSFGSEIGVKT